MRKVDLYRKKAQDRGLQLMCKRCDFKSEYRMARRYYRRKVKEALRKERWDSVESWDELVDLQDKPELTPDELRRVKNKLARRAIEGI